MDTLNCKSYAFKTFQFKTPHEKVVPLFDLTIDFKIFVAMVQCLFHDKKSHGFNHVGLILMLL